MRIIDLTIGKYPKVDFLFILDVIRPLEQRYYNNISISDYGHIGSITKLPHAPIWTFDSFSHENIAVLLHSIPIYLRDIKPESKTHDCIIDQLGAYFSNRKGESPYIELYMRTIANYAHDNKEHFKWLFTSTLLHELAHAALDINNQTYRRRVVEKVSYSTQFGRWREESMANAVVLKIVKEYGKKKFYNYTKNYMRAQPYEYALGVLMEDFGGWDFISVAREKENGVHPDLKKHWLKYVKGNPKWEELKKWNDRLSDQYVYYFKNEFYTSQEYLVYDIVDTVLSDYEKSNGKKMSFKQFGSLFPYFRTGAEMSYEPLNKVTGDSRYKKKVSLLDGDYALYYFWNNNTMHCFIENTQCGLVEYRNY